MTFQALCDPHMVTYLAGLNRVSSPDWHGLHYVPFVNVIWNWVNRLISHDVELKHIPSSFNFPWLTFLFVFISPRELTMRWEVSMKSLSVIPFKTLTISSLHSSSCHPCTHTASMTFIVLVVHVCPFPSWHRNKVHVHTVYSTTRCKIWLKESQPLWYYWRVTSGNGLTLFSCFPTTLVSMMTFNVFTPPSYPFFLGYAVTVYEIYNLF